MLPLPHLAPEKEPVVEGHLVEGIPPALTVIHKHLSDLIQVDVESLINAWLLGMEHHVVYAAMPLQMFHLLVCQSQFPSRPRPGTVKPWSPMPILKIELLVPELLRAGVLLLIVRGP